jgi:serine protease AprX
MNDQKTRPDGRASDRLLIKVILPRQGVERPVPGGGPKSEPFRPVDPVFRKSLSSRVQALRAAIAPVAKKVGAAPARVRLTPKAFAKSHRPDTLFSENTCPIIGAGKLGELFIRVTPSGLSHLDRVIQEGKTPKIVKELSSIETIEPITPEDRRGGQSAEDVIRHAPKTAEGYITKVQLFEIGVDQDRLEGDFRERCAIAEIQVRHGGYTSASQNYEVVCQKPADVEVLSRIVGVRSVRQMPVLTSIRAMAGSRRPLPPNLPLPDGPLSQYPVVGVIDSGIRTDIPALNAWLLGRESTVAPEYQNLFHGTFVAGLIAFPRDLNPSLNGLDDAPCAVFDVQVFPNNDPAAGDVDELTESELLQDLEGVLRDHSNEIRVWNLSLGTKERCSLDKFSSFAVELDRLQETYGVSIVISAGNYDERPRLDYPRTQTQLDPGRITTPADSVLGITVGSVSHVALPVTGPQDGEPSPFSRHGAGPNFIIKPDLVHYGGTCRPDGTQDVGVESIVADGIVGDGCGTSFSTPLVSRLLANIYHQVTPAPTRELARAILTHHARDPRNGERVPDTEENFLGFGLPTPTPQCLECAPWMSTLVFEDALRPGYFLEWDNFPFPASLTRNGRYFGDIWMTLAFAPARSATWGSEYCETHIDAHLGVFKMTKSRKTGAKEKFEGLVPPEFKNPGLLYESFQVERLRKWAPVRTYFGSLGEKGVRGSRWRLKLQLLSRHGLDTPQMMRPQPFALLVTIADPKKTAPVYDEMALKIRSRFQSKNLALRTAARVRART